MSELDADHSAALERVSPSLFHDLGACALRVAFQRQRHELPGLVSAAAVMGTLCHAVLETMVVTGAFRTAEWAEHLQQLWQVRVAAAEQSYPLLGPSASWPGFQIKRARLRTLLARLRVLLGDIRSEEILTEVELCSQDGRLFGRADLVVRSDVRLVIDYKTGGVMDITSGLPRQAYREQMQLYAYLEAQTTGIWPSRAVLMPLDSEPVDVDVNQPECEALADQGRALLAAYNSRVPGAQPPNVQPSTCTWCDFAVSCGAFWQVADSEWPGPARSVTGIVRHVWRSALGDVTLGIQADGGTVEAGDVTVRGLNAAALPAVLDLQEEQCVCLTCLRSEPDRGTLRASAATRLLIR